MAAWVVRDWMPAILQKEFNISQGKAGVSATLYWQVAAIAGLLLQGLNARLAAKRIQLVLSPEVLRWLADRGLDPVYGARPLRRFIQREIETPLARQLLAGTVLDGSLVRVTAHQVGLGVAAFQPGADGAGFAERAAVFELQHRNARQRASGAKSRRAVLLGIEVHHHLLDAFDAFFRDEHLHPPGVGRALRHIQLHGVPFTGADPFRLCPISTMVRASSANFFAPSSPSRVRSTRDAGCSMPRCTAGRARKRSR